MREKIYSFFHDKVVYVNPYSRTAKRIYKFYIKDLGFDADYVLSDYAPLLVYKNGRFFKRKVKNVSFNVEYYRLRREGDNGKVFTYKGNEYKRMSSDSMLNGPKDKVHPFIEEPVDFHTKKFLELYDVLQTFKGGEAFTEKVYALGSSLDLVRLTGMVESDAVEPMKSLTKTKQYDDLNATSFIDSRFINCLVSNDSVYSSKYVKDNFLQNFVDYNHNTTQCYN